jgi:hypothetical protein
VAFTITTEILLNGTWTDISRYVRFSPGITISPRGRGDEYATVPPTRGILQIDNRDGRFSPRLATGPYYGILGRNTQLRVRVTDLIEETLDDFTRTLSGEWGTSTTGLPWGVLSGNGGSLLNSDFNVTGSAATHSVPVAVGFRRSTLTDRAWLNPSIYAECTVAAPTGGPLEPTLMLRAQPGLGHSNYYMARAEIAAGGAVTALLMKTSGTTLASAVVPSLTHSAATPLKIRAEAFGPHLRMRIWQGSTEPTVWHVEVDDTTYTVGHIGLRSGIGTGNTNTKPVLFTWDNLRISHAYRLVGEVPAWPSQWDVSEHDVVVPVEVAGIGRRLAATAQPPTQSTIKREILSPTRTGRIAYWPMEDGSGAESYAAADPGVLPMIPVGPVTPATYSDWSASKPLPEVQNTGYLRAFVPSYTPTTETLVRVFTDITAGTIIDGSRMVLVGTNGTVSLAVVYQTGGGGFSVRANSNAVGAGFAEVYTSGTIAFGVDNRPISMQLSLTQSGANIDWLFGCYYIDDGSNLASSGTIPAQTVGKVHEIRLCDSSLFSDVPVGHLFLGNDGNAFDNTAGALRAWVGERAGQRIFRLCEENDVPLEWVGDLDDTVLMGEQQIGAWRDVIRAAADADNGILYEPRNALGYAYRTASSLYNQPATVALTYGAKGEVLPPLEPTDDDQYTRNDITVSRIDGSSATATQMTGPLSILAPPNGVGRYPEAPNLNLFSDDQLPDAAGWLLHQGTWDEVRFPSIHVNLRRLQHESKTALMAQAASLDVGDRLTITDPPAWLPPDEISQLAQGFAEFLNDKNWAIETNATPEGPSKVGVLDDTTMGRLDSADTVLQYALTTSSTTVQVRNDGPETSATPWSTTDEPYELTVGGEQIRVDTMTSNVPAFIGAGTAVTGVNASLSPAWFGTPTLGDLVVIVAAIRNGLPGGLPGVWVRLPVFSSATKCQLWGRIYDGTWTMPTVTFSGGGVNDTCIAQSATFRHTQTRALGDAQASNASAANITMPAATDIDRTSYVEIYVGVRDENWTSVATPAGTTEIGEPSSATGDNLGVVWNYRLVTLPVPTITGSWVVTGGINGVGISGVVALDATVQTATVTRARNGVTKAQLLAARPRLAQPLILGR